MSEVELRLKPGPHRALAGCPWIFRNELLQHQAPSGAIVRVVEATGRFVGQGFYSETSAIAVRLLVRTRSEAVDHILIRNRVRIALGYRQRLYPERDACRLINSEADQLPGLIADRYGRMVVIQVLSRGLLAFLPVIVEELVAAIEPAGVYERGTVPVRRHEGLPLEDRMLYGHLESPVHIHEHGVSYAIDVLKGQKTGHFLDQYENHRVAAAYADKKSVADVFCHTGGFGLTAARYGANSVVGVDLDESALMQAEANVRANGLSGVIRLESANAFDWLRRQSDEGRHFGQVILDPPAFTKSRNAVAGALRGYREINLRALKILEPGGILVTNSCSYHVSLDQFLEVVGEAAHDAHRHARLIEVRGQAPDHPMHPLLPESRYLKCLIFSVD